MTLPGWVGVREPRGRLGGRYAKNVTICPTQACTKPLDWMGRDPRPLARRLAPPPPPHGGCRVSRSSTVAVTGESARGGEGERRDTALSHDLSRALGFGGARGYMSGYRLPETVVHGVLCGTRCAARPAHLTPHLKRHRPLSVAQTDTGFTVTFLKKRVYTSISQGSENPHFPARRNSTPTVRHTIPLTNGA